MEREVVAVTVRGVLPRGRRMAAHTTLISDIESEVVVEVVVVRDRDPNPT